MMYLIATFFLLHTLPIIAQDCHARFDESIVGYCVAVDKCQGTVLATDTCEEQRCCIYGSPSPAPAACITGGEFNALYSTPRAGYLRKILTRAVDNAGICDNCHAKATFLAVAATMTDDFTSDEIVSADESFEADDDKYGNNQSGDGSKFRRRGFFGLRGRTMYERLQKLMPKYDSLRKPESVALVENGIEISARQWRNPNLLNETTLTEYANGSLYGFSMVWYKLNGDMDHFAEAVRHYEKFARAMKCTMNSHGNQGPVCEYNATHLGYCKPGCIQDSANFQQNCGCFHANGPQCPNSPSNVRCCLNNSLDDSVVAFSPRLSVKLSFPLFITLFTSFLHQSVI